MTTIGDEDGENSSVKSYSGNDFATQVANGNGIASTDMDATEVAYADGAARKSSPYAYGSYKDEELNEIYSWCEAVFDFSKLERDTADFREYSVILSTFIYKSSSDEWIDPSIS